jgi:hypothetical protein
VPGGLSPFRGNSEHTYTSHCNPCDSCELVFFVEDALSYGIIGSMKHFGSTLRMVTRLSATNFHGATAEVNRVPLVAITHGPPVPHRQ